MAVATVSGLLALLPAVPATARHPACPPERVARFAAIIADAGGNVALVVATLRGRMPTGDVQCWAATGDRRMQVELGRRLEAGDGIERDVAAAEALYKAAGEFRSGMLYIYTPGVGTSGGRVMPLRTGPDDPGLPEAVFARALLHIEGRAARPDYRRGLKLLTALAKGGYAPAVAKLAELRDRTA